MGKRILVVTTAPARMESLRSRVHARAGSEDAEVRVVAPAAKISRLDWLTNDEDEARAQAAGRRRGRSAGRSFRTRPPPRPRWGTPIRSRRSRTPSASGPPTRGCSSSRRPDEEATWLEQGAGEEAQSRFGVPVGTSSASGAARGFNPERGVSSAGRAPALQAGDHRFDPGTLRLVTSQGFALALRGDRVLHARPSLQMPGRRRTVPLRRVGATALGTLRRALVAGSEGGRPGGGTMQSGLHHAGIRGGIVAALAALVTLIGAGQALAAAPWNGAPISPGLGPTYGETVVRQRGAGIEHREPAGGAARAHPVRGDRVHAPASSRTRRRRRAPEPDDLSVIGQTAGGREPVRRRRERAGDAEQQRDYDRWLAAARDRARRPVGAGAPRVLGRRRKMPIFIEANIHGNEEEGADAMMQVIRDLVDHAVRDEPDRGQDPRPRDPRDDPEHEPGRPVHGNPANDNGST